MGWHGNAHGTFNGVTAMARTAGAQGAPEYRKLIKPNCSLSLGCFASLLGLFVVVEALLGLQFWRTGAWIITFFIGLESLFIAFVLFLFAQRRDDYELVTVDDRYVRVARRQGGRESQDEFQRYWARVSLQKDASGWYPSRLLLGSHGRAIEIGRALNERARGMMARELQKRVGH
jgi:uncharacterized membrane protein